MMPTDNFQIFSFQVKPNLYYKHLVVLLLYTSPSRAVHTEMTRMSSVSDHMVANYPFSLKQLKYILPEPDTRRTPQFLIRRLFIFHNTYYYYYNCPGLRMLVYRTTICWTGSLVMLLGVSILQPLNIVLPRLKLK